ncbi:radical SAM family heme chaperone HemW [Larsenimonas rhizosphaerae]|uniref:Heme chaperone HemW n=1 Tax=Larsenimonas rhizosphaerae TaxID=2944682 RepID=A0AA42CTT5_9GAMM|nr:radical SAM family heme chaperone HemW [Larsenimonas rhizosphaerae]MCX2523942.1 radical SAM family heme chaperone HemW [Larsenimonas rhizosphaerae]
MILPSIALYIHVPWCIKKCPYCDFNSHQADAGAGMDEAAYIDALIDDFKADAPMLQGRAISAVFIGGGTPSLFSDRGYARLFEALRANAAFDDHAEITMEANPGTAERRYLEGYREAGINRLSLGVQSLDETALRILGRIHGREEALSAFAHARSAGFDNINIDLMHGLPGQTVASAMDDLKTAEALGPEHLSWYQLTLEPNTAFYSRPPDLPDEDTLVDIQESGHRWLESVGYARYEISAYARGGRQSRHNLNYWTFGDYLGIGAGAHGKITHRGHDGELTVSRYWKTRQPEAYLRRRVDPRGFLAGQRTIDAEELPLEFLMNALRLVEGVPSSLWYERTGLSSEQLQAHLLPARQRGLLSSESSRIQVNDKGLLFLNDVLALCDIA